MFVLFCVSVGIWMLGCGLLGVGAALAYIGAVSWTGKCERVSTIPLFAGSALTLLGAALFVTDMFWWVAVAVWRLLTG